MAGDVTAAFGTAGVVLKPLGSTDASFRGAAQPGTGRLLAIRLAEAGSGGACSGAARSACGEAPPAEAPEEVPGRKYMLWKAFSVSEASCMRHVYMMSLATGAELSSFQHGHNTVLFSLCQENAHTHLRAALS